MTDASGREAIPEIAALIKKIDLCLFTTSGDDGQLHTRPMSNNGQVEWEGTSWFFAPNDGRLVAELQADPQAVAGYRAGDAYDFISISGRATIETDAELKKQYWLPELERWFPNGPERSERRADPPRCGACGLVDGRGRRQRRPPTAGRDVLSPSPIRGLLAERG